MFNSLASSTCAWLSSFSNSNRCRSRSRRPWSVSMHCSCKLKPRFSFWTSRLTLFFDNYTIFVELQRFPFPLSAAYEASSYSALHHRNFWTDASLLINQQSREVGIQEEHHRLPNSFSGWVWSCVAAIIGASLQKPSWALYLKRPLLLFPSPKLSGSSIMMSSSNADGYFWTLHSPMWSNCLLILLDSR